MQRIGFLTSGGDCGGLNAILKGGATTAIAHGVEPVLIHNGYAGLYNLSKGAKPIPLTPSKIDRISTSLAGSEAGNSRVKISKLENEDKYDIIKKGLQQHGIEALVIGGGDDSGSVALDLCRNGIPANHAPKTMDLDLQSYSVGGDSTINRIATAIDELRTTGITHNRVIILEVFGRYVGTSEGALQVMQIVF